MLLRGTKFSLQDFIYLSFVITIFVVNFHRLNQVLEVCFCLYIFQL